MIPPRDPNASHDRETLSALFDGELHGDAAHFASKRLVQDVRWRQSCGNWQLAGDVLRGRSMAPAPADFALRVQTELARETGSAATGSAAAMPVRRRWLGGAALAASVAAAAWFVATPFEHAGPATPAPTTTIAAAPPATPESGNGLPSQPAVVDTIAGLEDRQGPGDRSRRTAGRTTRPTASPRIAAAAILPAPQIPPRTSDESSTVLAGNSGTNAALVDPFQLPGSQGAVSRPWPRAVLPGYRSASTDLTAGYGAGLHNADAGPVDGPTFYPFEPRMAPDPDAVRTRPDQSGP